jgi:hypothetical protein
VIRPPGVPELISEIIARWQPPSAEREPSFIEIIETLKNNDFRVLAEIASDKVTAFIRRVESAEESGESE